MSDNENWLEHFVANRLTEIGIFARPTRGSGQGNNNEIGDILNDTFFIECKERLTKNNIIIDYKKMWLDLLSKMPMNNFKIPLIVTKNKDGEVFVTLKFEDFIDLLEDRSLI